MLWSRGLRVGDVSVVSNRCGREQLAGLGVDPDRSVASIDAAKFDNRPAWANKGKFDSRPGWDNWNEKK